MQIKCNNCNSIYNIPDAKISGTGAKAKCLKCKSLIIINTPSKASNESSKTIASSNFPQGHRMDGTFGAFKGKTKYIWIVLSIIVLLVVLPKAYNVISIKFNKPYNLLMSISPNSTVAEMIEANILSPELDNVELMSIAIKHIKNVEEQIVEPEENRLDLSNSKKFAIGMMYLNLCSLRGELIASNNTIKSLTKPTSSIFATFSGSRGRYNTTPFSTNDYWAIKWGTINNISRITLYSATGNYIEDIVSDQKSDKSASYQSKAGEYYLQVVSCGKWDIKIVNNRTSFR